MELKTRHQWCRELGKEYRLRADATPRGVNENGGKVYGREDFCLAKDQIERPPPVLTENQKFWQEVKMKKLARERRKLRIESAKSPEQLEAEEAIMLDRLKGSD